jgi:DNA replication and repair protein RecF
MRLRELELDEFRSFRKLHLTIDPRGFRLIGANASGKSTLLEAVAMLATTRSPRTSAEREIAHWQSGEELSVPPYARIFGAVERSDGRHTIEMGLSLDERRHGSLKKLLRFDDRPARAMDVVGQVKTVLFSPDDVDLTSGAPSARRRYLDMAISQGSRHYLRALSRYGKVLEQRNSLLRTFSRDSVPVNSPRSTKELAFWDSELAAAAVEVVATRLGAVEAISTRARLHFEALTGDESLHVLYVQNRMLPPEEDVSAVAWQSPSQHLRQVLSATFSNALGALRAEEFRRGVSAIGPHRDDFVVTAKGVDLGKFGSRGQQRLALIAIKIAELELLHEAAGEPPILLLDDVLSELDASHRSKVVSMLASWNAQICVTSTDIADLGSSELEHLPILKGAQGVIEPYHAH